MIRDIKKKVNKLERDQGARGWGGRGATFERRGLSPWIQRGEEEPAVNMFWAE